MGRSPLPDTAPAALEPAHRDTPLMGPGDSSDSGADLMGLDGRDDADPSLRPGLTPEDEDKDLAFVDEAPADDTPENDEADEDALESADADDGDADDEDEDEDDDRPAPARGGLPPALQFQGARARRFTMKLDRLHAAPPLPGQRPNPEPDRPQPSEPEAPEEDPPTEDEDHAPGRTGSGA